VVIFLFFLHVVLAIDAEESGLDLDEQGPAKSWRLVEATDARVIPA